MLPCGHGMCTHCFEALVARKARLTTCPLCRTRILKATPEEEAAAAAAEAEAAAAAQARTAAAAAQALGRVGTTDSARCAAQPHYKTAKLESYEAHHL